MKQKWKLWKCILQVVIGWSWLSRPVQSANVVCTDQLEILSNGKQTTAVTLKLQIKVSLSLKVKKHCWRLSVWVKDVQTKCMRIVQQTELKWKIPNKALKLKRSKPVSRWYVPLTRLWMHHEYQLQVNTSAQIDINNTDIDCNNTQ